MKLTIAGMGTGGIDSLTLGLVDAVRSANNLIVHTTKHPAYDYFLKQGFKIETLDSAYEDAEDFDHLCKLICDIVLNSVKKHEETCMLLIGQGLWEHTFCQPMMDMIRNIGAKVTLIGGISGASTAIAKAIEAGVSVEGARTMQTVFASQIEGFRPNVDEMLVIQEIDGMMMSASVKLWLSEYYPDEYQVFVVGENGSSIARKISVMEIDRICGDHNTIVVVLPIDILQRERFDFNALVDIMYRLRSPSGCPWDAEQTHDSLKRYLIEETYEVLEAIDNKDDVALYDELGDVLLQIVFHACIAKQESSFDDRDVTTAVCEKMIRRHPHVFGNVFAKTPNDVKVKWEEIKRDEKSVVNQSDVLKGVSRHLPALMRSEKVQDKAAQVGFDWDCALDALKKVFEEAKELDVEIRAKDHQRIIEELGDLLFAVVNTARLAKVDAEQALIKATDKFIDRFSDMEGLASEKGLKLEEINLDHLEELWQAVKALDRE